MSKRLALSKDVSHTKFLMKCKKKKLVAKRQGWLPAQKIKSVTICKTRNSLHFQELAFITSES